MRIPNDSPAFFRDCAQVTYDTNHFSQILPNAQRMDKITIDGWKIVLIKSNETGELIFAIRGTKSLKNAAHDAKSKFTRLSSTIAKMNKQFNDWTIEFGTIDHTTGPSEGGYFADQIAKQRPKTSAVTFNGHRCVDDNKSFHLRTHGDVVSGSSGRENYTTVGKKGQKTAEKVRKIARNHGNKRFGKYISEDTTWEDLNKDWVPEIQSNTIPSDTSGKLKADPLPPEVEEPEITPESDGSGKQEKVDPPPAPNNPPTPAKKSLFRGVASTAASHGLMTAATTLGVGYLQKRNDPKFDGKKLVKKAAVDGAETGAVAGTAKFVSNAIKGAGVKHASVPFIGAVLTVYHGAKSIYGIYAHEPKEQPLLPKSASETTASASSPPRPLKRSGSFYSLFNNYLEKKCSRKELDLSGRISAFTTEERESFFHILSEGDHEEIKQAKRILMAETKGPYLWRSVDGIIELSEALEIEDGPISLISDQVLKGEFYESLAIFNHQHLFMSHCRALSTDDRCSFLTKMEEEEFKTVQADDLRLREARDSFESNSGELQTRYDRLVERERECERLKNTREEAVEKYKANYNEHLRLNRTERTIVFGSATLWTVVISAVNPIAGFFTGLFGGYMTNTLGKELEAEAKFVLPNSLSEPLPVPPSQSDSDSIERASRDLRKSQKELLKGFSEARIDRLNRKMESIKGRIKEIKATQDLCTWRLVTIIARIVGYDLDNTLDQELTQLRTAKFYFQVGKVNPISRRD